MISLFHNIYFDNLYKTQQNFNYNKYSLVPEVVVT